MKLDTLFEAAVVAQVDLLPALSVPSGTSALEAVKQMRDAKRAVLFIVSGDQLAGIFTEVDFAKKILGNDIGSDVKIDDFMTADPKTVSRETKLADCFAMMSQGNFRHLPVVDSNGKPHNLLAVRHLVQFLAERFPQEVLAMAPDVHQVAASVDGG